MEPPPLTHAFFSSAPGRISLSPAVAANRTMVGHVFRLRLPWELGVRPGGVGGGRLEQLRDVGQQEAPNTALNCMRWIPVPGQGVVYATNTGLLKMLK